MMHSWDEIWNITQQRRSYDNALLTAMIDIRDRYNNDVNVYLPTVQDEPVLRSLSPQWIHDGIEHRSMRCASQLPSVVYPAITDTDFSMRRASTRGRATYASWAHSGLNLKLRRAFRHYCGYGTFAMTVIPDFDSQRASIELRDPLTCYPEFRNPDDVRPPINVAFVYGRSRDWLAKTYPQAHDFLYGSLFYNNNRRYDGQETLWDTVEWMDEDEIVIGILGPRQSQIVQDQLQHVGPGMELRRWPNRAGLVPVAVPRRITMDRIASQMASIVPIVDWAAKLTALEVLAAERGVFPDVYVLGDDNRIPELAGGQWKDGRTGDVNIVSGAKNVATLLTPPSQATGMINDRLDQAARFTGGIVPQMGGETGGSLRTGRAIDTMGSFSVDPGVAEAQDVMARALERSINPSILETEKGYWPNKKYTCFSGWAGDSTTVKYTPSVDFESTENAVTYAFPGTDVSQLSVALAQMMGAGLISRHTARVKHPLIDSAENEEHKLAVETLEAAYLAALGQQVTTGQLAAVDLVQILKHVRAGDTLEDATDKAQAAAQARQAQAAPPADQSAGQVGAPGAQPGLAGGNAGSAMGAPIGEMAGPAAQISTLRSLDHALRGPGLSGAGTPAGVT